MIDPARARAIAALKERYEGIYDLLREKFPFGVSKEMFDRDFLLVPLGYTPPCLFLSPEEQIIWDKAVMAKCYVVDLEYGFLSLADVLLRLLESE